MKSRYIAIAVVAMIAAVVLLSGCTSGPATNTTKATVKPTVAPTTVITSVPVTSVDAANVNTTMPDVRSGNNTSIINTSAGMREVPNSMLAGANNTTASVAPLPTTPPA